MPFKGFRERESDEFDAALRQTLQLVFDEALIGLVLVHIFDYHQYGRVAVAKVLPKEAFGTFIRANAWSPLPGSEESVSQRIDRSVVRHDLRQRFSVVAEFLQ